MIKQLKRISSITLSLAVTVGGLVLADESNAADFFRDFQVQVDRPLVDSVSAYHLSFTLSNDTYGSLHNGRLIFEFPGGFGLESVESVTITTDHPNRQYRVDRITVDDEKLILRLKRIGGGRFDPSDNRVNFDIGIFVVHNPEVSGHFQLTATSTKRDNLIAGPSVSEAFEIIQFHPEPHAELQIVSTELIVPNSPKVNTGQEFTIEVLVANVSDRTAHNVSVELVSDGQSNINSPKTIEILEPNDTATVLFEVTASPESGTENFTSDIISSNVIDVEAVDDTAGAVIQTPALLVWETLVEDGDTIFVESGKEVRVFYNVVNQGEASVSGGRLQIDGGEILVPVAGGYLTIIAPPFEIVEEHSLNVIEIPIDVNTNQPAIMDDTEFEFTVVVNVAGEIGFEESFIVENNPFNPNDGPVTFVYNLSGESDVEFNIFTVTGEEVYSHTYLSGSEGGNSGTNLIQWDGRNSEGEIVLNGVYVTILNVLSTGEKASLKLAVLK